MALEPCDEDEAVHKVLVTVAYDRRITKLLRLVEDIAHAVTTVDRHVHGLSKRVDSLAETVAELSNQATDNSRRLDTAASDIGTLAGQMHVALRQVRRIIRMEEQQMVGIVDVQNATNELEQAFGMQQGAVTQIITVLGDVFAQVQALEATVAEQRDNGTDADLDQIVAKTSAIRNSISEQINNIHAAVQAATVDAGGGSGGETPPVEGGGGETPPVDNGGGEVPPVEGGGGETPPVDVPPGPVDGGETPPVDGGEVPPADGGEVPVDNGGIDAGGGEVGGGGVDTGETPPVEEGPRGGRRRGR